MSLLAYSSAVVLASDLSSVGEESRAGVTVLNPFAQGASPAVESKTDEPETVESPPGNGQQPAGPTIIVGEMEEPSQPVRPEDSRP